MRLGVEAALVRGELVPGDVEVEDGVVVGVGLPNGARGLHRRPRLRRPAGERLRAASTSSPRRRADYERAGEALLEGGVTAYQPTFITAPEATLARRAARRCRRRRRRA